MEQARVNLSWDENATALTEKILKELTPEKFGFLNTEGKKNLFRKSCETLLEHGMKPFSAQFTQALEDSGAIRSHGGIWVTSGDSVEDKDNFEQKLSQQLITMNKFWNTKTSVHGVENLTPMEITKECCERIDQLALKIFEEGDKSAIVNAGGRGIFLSHRGPSQKAVAKLLKDKLRKEIKFGNNTEPVPVFLDIDSMLLGANNLENICYAICGVERIVILLNANIFTSEWCVLELFLACARRNYGFQDNRLLPVYVQDNDIYRRDSDVNKTKGIPLPFDESTSYTVLTPSNPGEKLLDQLKNHFFGLKVSGLSRVRPAPVSNVGQMNAPQVQEYFRIGLRVSNALRNSNFDLDRYSIEHDTKGVVLGNDILYPMRDRHNPRTEFIIKVTNEKVVGYYETNSRYYSDVYVRNDHTMVFQGQGGVNYLLHPDAVSDCLTDLYRFRSNNS